MPEPRIIMSLSTFLVFVCLLRHSAMGKMAKNVLAVGPCLGSPKVPTWTPEIFYATPEAGGARAGGGGGGGGSKHHQDRSENHNFTKGCVVHMGGHDVFRMFSPPLGKPSKCTHNIAQCVAM